MKIENEKLKIQKYGFYINYHFSRRYTSYFMGHGNLQWPGHSKKSSQRGLG